MDNNLSLAGIEPTAMRLSVAYRLVPGTVEAASYLRFKDVVGVTLSCKTDGTGRIAEITGRRYGARKDETEAVMLRDAFADSAFEDEANGILDALVARWNR